MRIGVISDVHANLPALDAALSALRSLEVDRILCCGDIIGCGPWPAETLDTLRREAVRSVRGNHDDAVLHLARYRRPGAEDDLRMLSWTDAQLDGSQRAYLAGLPRRHCEGHLTLAHGSLRSPLEQIEYVLDIEAAQGSFDRLDTWIGLLGHAHIQSGFVQDRHGISRLDASETTIPLDLESRYLINPGSVGLPRDGDTRAAYAWLDLDAGSLGFGRAAYDAAPVARAMRDLGFDTLCRFPLPEAV